MRRTTKLVPCTETEGPPRHYTLGMEENGMCSRWSSASVYSMTRSDTVKEWLNHDYPIMYKKGVLYARHTAVEKGLAKYNALLRKWKFPMIYS